MCSHAAYVIIVLRGVRWRWCRCAWQARGR